MDKINGNVLVVDDDSEMCKLLSDALSEEGHHVRTAGSAEEALPFLSNGVDLLITDLRLKAMEGLDLMHRVRKEKPEIAVIIITAFGTIESAIEAMKLGAYDYIPKPFKMAELILVVQKALHEGYLRREVARLREEIGRGYQFNNIIGKSKPMRDIFDLIQRIAGTSSNVLVIGESGTGKELVAKAIHYNSPRKDRPFLPVNCAAIPETLLESELFGYNRGAFTDAKGDRAGLFEEARSGTLFLDEISEMPFSLQAKLLRVLEEKEVRRLGSSRTIKVDVRVIAASNLALEEEIKKKRFRDDLFYRLNVIQIKIPPLREHRDDILPLIHHFLTKFQKETGKKISGVSESALSLLVEYAWPGNVRELENAIERAVILTRGEEIATEDLPAALTGNREDFSTLDEAVGQQLTLEELEHRYIARILDQTHGNKFRAAQLLGIDRKTLYRKLKGQKDQSLSQPIS